jgi:hypothetical protein
MLEDRNLGTLIFLPGDGDELLESLGLIHSEAGIFWGENRISRVGISFCLNSHLKGFSIGHSQINQCK